MGRGDGQRSRVRRARLGAIAVVIVLASASASAVGEPAPDHIHFTAAGDYSAVAATTSVLDGVAAAAPDAHFALGDLSYSSANTPTESAWCDYVTSHVGAGFPFELLTGNHESSGQNGLIDNFSACLPNQLPGVVGTYGQQYFVDVPQKNPLLRYIMISPNLPFPDGAVWSYGANSPRYAWTRDTIDQARAKSIPWVVVGMHKPCLSRGQYACDPGADLVNLLLDRKVDVVLSGHEHIYERTKQLGLGQGCLSLSIGAYNPSCVVDGDNQLVAGAGTVFLTIGTGGVAMRNLDTADPENGYFAAGQGLNTTASHGFGDFQATPDRLDVSFVRTSGGAYSDAFSIVRGAAPPNSAPTAAFSSSTSGLTAQFDGTGSFDTDGAVATYAWVFGDGSSGTGATTPHTYAAAGTYPVTLTVTDDDGATDAVTKQVTVSAPSAQVLGSDDFDRSVSNGWGRADQGGTWASIWSAEALSVGSGSGVVSLPSPGIGPYVALGGGASDDTDLEATIALDKVPVGGTAGIDAGVIVRRVLGQGQYRMRLRFLAGGVVRMALVRVAVSGAQTTLVGETVVSGLDYAVNDVLRLRVQATGTSPTTLRAKVWRAGTTEPSSWMQTITDNTAGLQSTGTVGFHVYLASTVTNAPIQAKFDAVRSTVAR